MKVRIKFAKEGVMKFIGHLDIMRYFQKAIRRAEIDIAFSEGFSPHMIMSFASPLGVGTTSTGEYFDIELRTPVSSAEAVKRLNAVMADGMRVLSFRQVADGKSSNAMAIVAAAEYTVHFRDGYAPADGWQEKLAEFAKLSEIKVLKKTKKNEVETNIRPMIYELSTDKDQIHMLLASGSAANLKPDLVMSAFADYLETELPEIALLVHRNELYADIGTDGQRRLVSLEDLGEEITLS
ncbi:MAG: TIGR03936 family radical SAM-associated protein [Lachnospiraceae bacterium]|nr:TIGR03936 family radical SAM-associated protein [Lachnospiraceae bacterium]